MKKDSHTKKIITYGTFDLFHFGHVRLLQRMRALGDELHVGLSSDEFNNQKGKSCVIPYEHRKEVLLSCRYVDSVFPEESWDQKLTDIVNLGADIFAMGDDWSGKFDFLEREVKVIYLPRTEGVSTTELKMIVDAFNREKIYALQNMLESSLEHLKSIKL